MVEHRTPVQQRFAPAHEALVRTSCTPPLGQHLRMAVDKVLGELSVTTEPDGVTLRALDDLLVAGLAWAAATGDTCRIQSAVQAVRVAREQLTGVDPAGARSALLAARDRLRRPPAERREAPAPRTETDTERDISRRNRPARTEAGDPRESCAERRPNPENDGPAGNGHR